MAIPSIDYYGACNPADVHHAIRRARMHAPIAVGPYGPEVLNYDLVRGVLRDSRFAMPTGIGLAAQGVTRGPVWDRVCRSIVSLDGADHLRLRRLVARAFTPSAADRMRSTCAAVITELLDRYAAAGRCEVVSDIARNYPIPIICATMGVPQEDWPQFSSWLRGIGKAFGVDVAAASATILAAWESLDGYLEQLIADRRVHLGADLLSELIRAEDEGDRLGHDELLSLIAILLIAGTDTTRNQLAATVQVLCAHPKQWAMVSGRPELAPQAVVEAMRHSPVSFSTIRVAVEDVDLAGMRIAQGTFVVANTAAANRDPAVFDDPDRFDITRQNTPPILTFGGGAHHCLGAHLARVQLSEALADMTRRMPDARIVGPAPWKPIVGISGPRTLPIEFGPLQ